MKGTYTIALILLICECVLATNYYVSNSGQNTNSGLSLDSAFQTVQYVIDNKTLGSGDTVFVTNGTYQGFNNWDWSGSAIAPLVFKALGDNVRITTPIGFRDDGINIENVNYVVVDGFICDSMPGSGNGIRVVNADHCVVRNCSATGNAERGILTGFTDDILIEYNTCVGSLDEHGIYVSNSSDRAVIRYNTCYDNNNIGIHCNADRFAGGDGISEDFEIYGNTIYNNNLAAGINLDGIINAKVYNNLIFNNHNANGIICFQIDGAVPSTGAEIYNNTIVVPSDGRWGICFKDGSHDGAKVYNNIVLTYHASRGSICTEGTTNFTSDHNVVFDRLNPIDDNPGNSLSLVNWQNQTGQDQHSIVVDTGQYGALFEDLGQDNYDLASNSIAIDTGTNLVSGLVINDLDGSNRPLGSAYDIGAYEKSTCLYETLIIGDPIDQLVYDNADQIEISGMVNMNAVTLQAQTSIELMQEFEVLGYIFEMIIQDCQQ